MLRFSEMEPIEEENLKNMPEKIIQSEPPFTLIEYPLNDYGTALHEIALVSEMSIINDKKNFIIAPGQDT